MKPIHFSWPEGKAGAFTSSWDDGCVDDRRLVAMLNRHGMRGTWNLNSERLGIPAKGIFAATISADEAPLLYAGHEVAVHAATHAWLWRLPDEAIFSELIEDRRNLERIVGHPVQGMALPYGGADDCRVRQALARAGILYARPTDSTNGFELPDDFLYWRPTCHRGADLNEIWGRFLANSLPDKLFFVWGHSFEYATEADWEAMEAFCTKLGSTDGVWMATNMEIYEYVTAARSLQCSVALTSVRNRSATPVWIRTESDLHRIDAGCTVRL